MAIVGLGTDIVQINRIEQTLERLGVRFAKRILTVRELESFQQSSEPARYLAKRFAAKEAASKALGTGIACGVCFTDFEITKQASGEPKLHLFNRAHEIATQKGMKNTHISISDEKEYAVVTVVLESC